MPGYVMAQYFEEPALKAFLEALLESAQEIETALLALRTQFRPSDAEGFFLDLLGEDVGESRDGRPDLTYALAIAARLRINRSSGTWDQIIEVALILSGDPTAPVHVANLGNMTGEITVYADVSELDAAVINRLLQSMVAAGGRLYYIYLLADADGTFTFTSGNKIRPAETTGFGDDVAGGVGGVLAGVFVSEV
jgi:hypothetical protein